MINIKKFGDFLKRTRVNNKNKTKVNITSKVDSQDIQIQIEGNIDLFKDEREKIIEGAKQLLELGKADNIEEAIVTFAVMFRGLKFSEIKNTEEGTKIVVLRETAQGKETIIAEEGEIQDR